MKYVSRGRPGLRVSPICLGCITHGVRPLARGRLTHDWDETSARSETDEYGRTLYLPHTAGADRRVVDAVGRVAAARDVSRGQVALA